MSFSQDVKQEIMSHIPPEGCCAVAAAYGVACFGKYFDSKGIVLHTERTGIAQYAKKVFSLAGVEGKIYARGKEDSRMYEFAVKDSEQIEKMFSLFGGTGTEPSLRINSKIFQCEHCVQAFISAAFLCSGTITDPSKEYNLEFLSNRYGLIQDFSALLMGHGFLPKTTRRRGGNVLYFKASEQIEDMLTYMGASGSSLQLMNLKVYKDLRNKANRITNCETANIDKIVSASGKTIEAIQYLQENGALETLPETLRVAADCREKYPDLPLKELALQFDPPLSKSGLSHRMKKIEQIAATLMERNCNA